MCRWAPGLLAVLLAGLVSGCGFHLRGLGLETSVQSVFVSGPNGLQAGRSELAGDLRSAFAQNGVEITEQASDAELLIAVLDEQRGRRSLSVTGQARAAEWELTRSLQFSASQPGEAGAQTLIDPRWIEVKRFFRVDRNNIVGSNEEQRLIERELKSDLIQQVLRSINQILSQRAEMPGGHHAEMPGGHHAEMPGGHHAG
jgi:LPS-assembly lipoprotein